MITGLGPDGSVKASGIEIGDVVLKVDGEPVHDRMKRLGRYITASTPQAHTYMVMNRLLLAGATGSSMTLTVHDHEGRERKRKLTRVPRGSFSAEDGEVLRLLEGNIGYADLRRLTVAEVDGMFERFPSAHPGSKRQTALPGQDGDDDRRAGDQPIRAHRAVLRGGERHDVHRQPDDGHQWRRHDLDPPG